jgi:Nucleotidyl transferase AbiEii toxin, Type IV TA system
MLHTETVEKGTLALIKKLMADPELQTFYLVGGTALSLKMGHRKSIDIDLFTDKEFDAKRISESIISAYHPSNIRTLKNGIFCFIENVKVDVIAHQYPLINKVEEAEGIRMLSLQDIGAMKLNAIHGNGTRLKDFIDVYVLLEHLPLQDLLLACEYKYVDISKGMAKNALLYHNDIEFSEKLDFIGPELKWEVVVERLKRAVVQPKIVFKNKDALSQKLIKKSTSVKRKKGGSKGI